MRLLLLSALFSVFSYPVVASTNPLDLYGESIRFDIYRDGDVIGEHVTTFSRRGEDLVVQSRTDMEITILFIPVFQFSYQSKEVWRAERLAQLRVRVDDGGDKYEIDADRQSGALLVEHPENRYQITGTIFPTNHWNKGVTEEERVLNTLTGNINNVTVTATEREPVLTPWGMVPATRYDYDGDLTDTSAWYDDQGRWVKLRFKGRDGSNIEYRCQDCKEVE